ncbi:MAG: DUF2283 domain-containing protein [Nitrospirae bacterium]|nr:DUF2283 domain-containing protein [Nitrospirota bacterium]
MKISYDTKADAAYITLKEGEFARNKEVEEGIVLDIGKDGSLLGIEILEASTRMSLSDIATLGVEMPLDLAAS